MKLKTAVLIAACAVCLDWSRLTGTVKGINLRDSTVTIQNRDGDLLTIPVDYQVFISDKHRDPIEFKKLVLDEQITLIRTVQEKPADDAPTPPYQGPAQRGD